MDACEAAWKRFAADPGLIRSLCAVALTVGDEENYAEEPHSKSSSLPRL